MATKKPLGAEAAPPEPEEEAAEPRLCSRREAEDLLLGAAQPVVGSAILRRKSPGAFVVSFVAAGGGVGHAGIKLVGTQYVSASGRAFDSLTVRENNDPGR